MHGADHAVQLHLRLNVQRRQRHRQHPALRAEQPANPVQRLHGVVHQFPERHDQQVADRVATQLALAPESVLDDPVPSSSPLVVPA